MSSDSDIKNYARRLGIDPEYLPTADMRKIAFEYEKKMRHD
jgi:predicted DNA-binding protein (UPF0278 family)